MRIDLNFRIKDDSIKARRMSRKLEFYARNGSRTPLTLTSDRPRKTFFQRCPMRKTTVEIRVERPSVLGATHQTRRSDGNIAV